MDRKFLLYEILGYDLKGDPITVKITEGTSKTIIDYLPPP